MCSCCNCADVVTALQAAGPEVTEDSTEVSKKRKVGDIDNNSAVVMANGMYFKTEELAKLHLEVEQKKVQTPEWIQLEKMRVERMENQENAAVRAHELNKMRLLAEFKNKYGNFTTENEDETSKDEKIRKLEEILETINQAKERKKERDRVRGREKRLLEKQQNSNPKDPKPNDPESNKKKKKSK